MTQMDPFDVLHSRISVSGACSPNNVLASYFIIFAGTMFEAVWLHFMNGDSDGEGVWRICLKHTSLIISGNTKPTISHKNNKNV